VTRPLGEEQLPGVANYFIGSDPAGWHTNIPTFAKVRYAGVYPGIDLVYYGNQRQLEYDFAVAPGASPGVIRLELSGAKQLHVAANGDLVFMLGNGTLAFQKPLVYQVVDGHRQPVAGTFALLGKHTVGFRLGSYDRARPLVIDPVLQYSTYLGGSAGAQANAIAVDTAGNAYVAATRARPISRLHQGRSSRQTRPLRTASALCLSPSSIPQAQRWFIPPILAGAARASTVATLPTGLPSTARAMPM